MNRALLALPIAAALLAGGCGSDDDTSTTAASTSSTAKTTATTSAAKDTLPSECSTNADGKVTKLDKAADTGTIKIKNVGNATFKPSKDTPKGAVKKGDHVYLTYKDGKALCVLPVSK
jgi:hypothetical protein